MPIERWTRRLAETDFSHEDQRRMLCDALQSATGTESADWDGKPWVRDVFSDRVIYEWSGDLWQAGYSIDDGGTVALAASVKVKITYEPLEAPAPAAESVRDRAFRERVVRAIREHEPFRSEVAKVIASVEAGEPIVEGEPVLLLEKAMRADNTMLAKIIQPGWGSTGHYSAEVLERDGPGIFPIGTHMYWNHPTDREEAERPEGSLRDLAGELVSGARWIDEGSAPAGAGLYADAKVFPPFADVMDDLAPAIGLSIRGAGVVVEGEAEGRRGPIVQKLTAGRSVDFVTAAGAGGKILELFESARETARQRLERPEEVTVDEKDLKEAQAALAESERKLAEATAQLAEKTTAEGRANDALRIVAAEKFAAASLAESKLPETAKARVIAQVSANPPAAEDGSLDESKFGEAVTAAAKAEAEYLAKLTGSGQIRGMGGASELQETETDAETLASMEKSFGRLGLSEADAKIAAAGRQ